MAGATTYSRSEVIWLLSLSHQDAIEADASQRDSCADLSADLDGIHGGGDDGATLPVIARWVDVQRARREVVTGKEALAVLQLRAGGFSERELARLANHERLAVRRRWHASVDDILQALGGSMETDLALSHVDLCLRCAERPRVTLAPVKARVRGGWKVLAKERQASVCVSCLAPDLHVRIMGEFAQAA